MAKVSSLHVVTNATATSTLEDICFRVNLPEDLYKQFMGGLKPEDIVAFYEDKGSAEEKAKLVLHRAKAERRNKSKKLFEKMMEEE